MEESNWGRKTRQALRAKLETRSEWEGYETKASAWGSEKGRKKPESNKTGVRGPKQSSEEERLEDEGDPWGFMSGTYSLTSEYERDVR